MGLAFDADAGNPIDHVEFARCERGVDLLMMLVDVAGDGIEREDAGVIDGVDRDHLEQDAAQVRIAGVDSEEYGEGLFRELIFLVKAGAGRFDSFGGRDGQGGVHG